MKKIITVLLLCFVSYSTLKAQNNQSLNLEWKSRGPSNIHGHTMALLWDKNDENVLYTGGIGSGLYKTEDKGAHWTAVHSFLNNNQNITCLAQNTSGTIFAGTGTFNNISPTGELFNYGKLGNGIYRSTDQGNSWTHIASTNMVGFNEWKAVTALAFSPTNNNLLIAGTNNGLRIFTQAESSQPTYSVADNNMTKVQSIRFSDDGKTLWVTASGRLYKSEDYSNNFISGWQNIYPPLNGSRATVALSSTDTNGDYTTYYICTNYTGCLLGLFKSEDKGNSWVQIGSTNSLDPFRNPSNQSCIGWFAQSLEINPENKDIIYIGGVTTFSVTPQNTLVQIDNTLNTSSSKYMPKYKHTIVINPANADEIMIGTGNGIYFSNNALSGYSYTVSYNNKSNGLNTSQLLNADIGKNGEILYASINHLGLIDYAQNSPYESKILREYTNVTSEISNYNESVILTSLNYGALERSINRGTLFTPFLDTVIDPAQCDFITCTPLLPNQYCGSLSAGSGQSFYTQNYLYESANDAKYFVPTRCGNKLFVCTNPLKENEAPKYSAFKFPYISGTKAMHFSQDGDRVVYGSGSYLGILNGFSSFVPSTSTPGNATINNAQISANLIDLDSLGIQSISGVYINPNDANHILVCEDQYSSNNKVSHTFDGGLTWDSIHNNLPEIPIYDCLIDVNNASNYILATEKGIWTSNNAGQTWIRDNDGFSEQLSFFRLKQQWVLEENCYVLLAASFGNGVYTSTSLTSCSRNVEDEIWGTFNSINQLETKPIDISIFPNPSKTYFNIEITNNEGTKNVAIYDIYGKKVYSNTINESLKVSSKDWAKGIYIISIENQHVKVLIQ